MPRIPQAEIERLKAEVSVQRLAEARGIVLQPHGQNLIGLCPFHDDHEPSLVITPGKNLWNCLGACGCGGSVIDWVMKAEGVSFRHAVEILRTGAVPAGSPVGPPPKVGTVRKLPPPVSLDAEDRELLRQVVAFYHQTLAESPEALGYLDKRGLNNAEMIDRFHLGFANRTLGLRLPAANRKTGAAIRERLTKLGIIRETGHEHFNGSIVFPVFDEHGHVSGIYGRKAADVGRLRAGTAYHLYLPGPHKGVWNAPALSACPDVILCEAIIDALTFWCSGFRNVTAAYGVNGFTPDHLDTFRTAGIKRVFIAYDRDEAGDKAAEALAPRLLAEGYEVFRILFPRGMDANAYALEVRPPEKSLGLVIRNAVWMGKGESPSGPGSAGPRPADRGPTDRGEDPQEPAATDEPPAPKPDPIPSLAAGREPAPIPPEVEIRAEEIVIRLDDRRWRVRGLAKNMSHDQLKVNLLVSRGDAYFVDTFDLYSARSRGAFQKQAADEVGTGEGVIRSDLGRILLALEELQDRQIREALEPKEKPVVLNPEERAEAMDLLKDPRLIERILEDFERCGIVGERTNKLTGYLAAVSRKLITPLAVIIQSSSAAGKTSLMEAVLAFIPEEDRVKYSAMTGQSLFYMGETNLKHKILAIVEEEGAERASYALKLLQSEGELTIASTGKDPQTGRMVTHEYRVEGPVMIFVTTTSIDIDPELQNRCIVLTVDESREQTRAIHQRQRERRTLEGLWARQDRQEILARHRNAQRLLQPVHIINPYARRLTFLDDRTRTRRDHDRYLDLIESITVLHQFQRPFQADRKGAREVRYLEVTLEDIELANRLMHEVLGRSLDELPPQTRRFLVLLEEMVRQVCENERIDRKAYRFHRRDVLNAIGWSYDRVRIHMERLIELEYVLIHGGHQGRRISYEMLYDGRGKDGETFVCGLLDVEAIRAGKPTTTMQTLGGSGGTLEGKTPTFGGRLDPILTPFGPRLEGKETPQPVPIPGQISGKSRKNAHLDQGGNPASYPQVRHTGRGKGNGSGSTIEEAD